MGQSAYSHNKKGRGDKRGKGSTGQCRVSGRTLVDSRLSGAGDWPRPMISDQGEGILGKR